MKYLLILLTLLFITSCNHSVGINEKKKQKTEKNERFEVITTGSLPWLMIDKETGCQYVANGNNTPYTPLLDVDGSPYCPK